MGINLYLKPYHPLCHLKKQIINHLHKQYENSDGNPMFSVFDLLSPVVTTHQNFDSLLIPEDHVSRQKSDNYYINKQYLLRAHTSAHQSEIIKSGVDSFLIVGDVYRRDEIDSSHFPVFHQLEGVRLFRDCQLQELTQNMAGTPYGPHEGNGTVIEATLLKDDLQNCLGNLALSLFGKDTSWRWVDAYFPFTHPSWELEVKFGEKWLEMLGCGIIRQEILTDAGARNKVGWAFGLGLERWAMKLYDIPDIRIFWSEDSGFLSQFAFDNPSTQVKYKPVSHHPQCINDISFWLPSDESFNSNDFYDIVRSVGGSMVEQVSLIDQFVHPKTKRISHCYRIVYRDMSRALSQQEVNTVHTLIEKTAAENLNVDLR